MTNLKKMIFSKINGEHENDHNTTEKRELEDTEAVRLLLSNKKIRVQESDSDGCSESSLPQEEGPVLKPYPYFYYTDYSTEKDDGCKHHALGRIPSFTKKLHEILSCEDFQDIIAWNPHGRSWRVLKPKEFELSVIPAFFDHHKFSSFIRQANGWGFRRITEGPDRNSYYHERFLRGLPHLCKKMKRPGVSEKKMNNPDQEPDLYAISQKHPIPELKRKKEKYTTTTNDNSHWVVPATATSKSSPVMVLDEEESKRRVPTTIDISSTSTAVSSPSSTPSPTPTMMSPSASHRSSIDMMILEELVSRHQASAAAATASERTSFAVPAAITPTKNSFTTSIPFGLVNDYSSRLIALQLQQLGQNARLAELVSGLNPPSPQLPTQSQPSTTFMFAPRPQMNGTTSALAREYLRVLANQQQQPSFRFI